MHSARSTGGEVELTRHDRDAYGFRRRRRGVDIDVQPLPRCGGGSCRPRRCSGCGAPSADPWQVRGVDALIDQPPHRRGRRLRTQDMLTVAAQLPHPVDAIGAIGDRGGQIGEHLPGCVHPRPPPTDLSDPRAHAPCPSRHATPRHDCRPRLSPAMPPRYSSPAKCLPARAIEPSRIPIISCRTGTFAYLHPATHNIPRRIRASCRLRVDINKSGSSLLVRLADLRR